MKTKLTVGIAVLLFFAVVFLFVIEFNYFNRYLNMGGFVGTSLVVGFLMGLFVIILLRRYQGQEQVDRWRMKFLIWMICMVPMPLILSLTNRLLDQKERETVTIEFVEEEARFGSLGVLKGEKVRPNAHHLVFYLDDRLYRIISAEPQFPNAEEGDLLEMPIRKGFLGFRWIDVGIKQTTKI